MTLKIESRPTKTLHILNLSQRHIHLSLMNVSSFVQEISHFSNKINFCQLAGDLENEVNVIEA